jgi:hypothetical protein
VLTNFVNAYAAFEINDTTNDAVTTTTFTLSVASSAAANCSYSADGNTFTVFTSTGTTAHTSSVVGIDTQLNIYEIRCEEDSYGFTKSRYVWVNINTASVFEGLVSPLFGEGTIGWRYFFLPRLVLNDMDLSSYDVVDVLSSINGSYTQVWYHDPSIAGVNGWKYYIVGDSLSTLTTMSDWDSSPYWINMTDTSIEELRISSAIIG